MKKYSKIIAVLLAVAMILPGIAQAAPVVEEGMVTRLSGDTRVETAIAASKEAYKGTADAVVLAGYNGEVDALTGTLLANDKKAPLLLTTKDSLSAATKAEIERLKPTTIYILGGDTVVSAQVEADLKDYTVKRVKGDNRAETAGAVAKEVKGTSATHVFLTLGWETLADALAIGPVSAMKDMPVLLTETDKLPTATVKAMEDLGVTDVTIVGGTNAVSAAIQIELDKKYTVNRVSGDTRENTALAIAAEYFTTPGKIVVAFGRGVTYADALVGGYLGALQNAPVLLTTKAGLTAEIKAYITANAVNTYVLGGENVITTVVVDQIETALAGEVVEEEGPEIVTVSAISVDKTTITLLVDATETLVETVLPSKATNKDVIWTSSDEAVATVANGVVTAVSEGTATITATTVDGSKTADCIIIVQSKYNYLELNKPYTANDDMTITVTSIQKNEEVGSIKYTVSYILKNETADKKIDEATFKMYFEDGTNLPQYGFFGSLFPGQSLSRSYTFEFLKTKVPTLIEYEADFFATEPSLNTLKWKVN